MPINGDQALKSLDGNLGLLKELAAIFADDSPQLLDEFESAVADQNVANARLAAHSLKGLTSTFYASPEVEKIATIEQAAAEGNWNTINDATQSLRQIVDELLVEMRNANWLPN